MGSRQDLRGKTPLAHLGQEPHGRHGTPPAALPDRATPVRQDVLRVRLSRGAWPTRHDRLKNLEGIHPETLADAVANRRRAQ
ncbi:MAG: hypothetical protein EOM91_23225 [Sphingobacteriia bacterium]|nr:hypothetical protein [Sphingobacteriia bacterium]